MEIEILKWVHATFHAQTWLNYIMVGITWLGEFGAGAIILALVLLIFKKTRSAGFAVGVALVIDFLIVNILLKYTVNRPRPWTEWEELNSFYDSVNGIRQPTDSSFPSGHTAIWFAAATALTLKEGAKGAWSFVVAVLMAISRIYLCLHYPTDVIGGVLIGAACGFAGYFAALFISRIFSKRKKRKNE